MSDQLFNEDFLQRLERLSLAARKAMAGQTQGERRSIRRGNSVEFSDFRPYVAGDDFRRIDWNAYARMERFFIKLFVEEEDISVHLLLDNSASMRWGQPEKLGYAIRAAAALGYIALCGLERVTATALKPSGSSVKDGYFPFHRGKNQAPALFGYMQSLLQVPENNNNGEMVPSKLLQSYASASNSPGLLFLFSDLMDDGWLEGLSALASRGYEISVIHILSPDEVEPEIEGDLKLLDIENGAMVEVTADYDLLTRYRQNLADWKNNIQAFCGARAMNYIPVETSMPLEQLLFAWMRRMGAIK